MSDTPYSARIRAVELLERNKNQVTNLVVYRDNSIVTPTMAKYSLISSEGNYILTEQAATIETDGVISFTHTASQLPLTLSLGEGYVQEFHVTISSVEYVFRRMAALVLRKLYPVVSDTDLTSVYSDLESLRPSTLTSYQKYIDDSWYQILRKIRTKGMGFEYLIMSPESFYESHRHLALYLIFRDFHSSLGQSNGRFLDLAQEHHRMYVQEFEAINFIYDQDHDKKPDDINDRKNAQPVIYLTGQPYYNYRYRYNWRK